MTSPRRGPAGSDRGRGTGGSRGGSGGGARQGGSGGRPQRPAGHRGARPADGSRGAAGGGERSGSSRDEAYRARGGAAGGEWGRRPSGDRPHRDRPQGGDRPQRDRAQGDRPNWQDRRPGGDRPQSSGGPRREWQDRRPGGDRPHRDRPQGGDRPRGVRPQGDRPSWQDRRPSGDRPQSSGGPRREWQDRRPGGDRPQRDRPQGDRPAWQDRRPERAAGTADRPAWQDRRPAGRPTDGEDCGPRRPAGPALPDWADARELDVSVRSALRGLDARNADTVGRHLVAAGGLLDDDPELALEHARAARDRASRLAPVREAVGVAAYHAGDFAEAARELRAYARMSGDDTYRAVLADCERALGRPENALRLVQQALETHPDAEELVELRLVEAGARQDLGEGAAAALVLEAALGGRPTPAGLGHPDLGQLRLATAYADLLDGRGEAELAHEWYSAIAAADPDDLTGVSEHFAGDDEDSDEEVGDDLTDLGLGAVDEAPGQTDAAEITSDDVDAADDAELTRALAREVGGEVTQEDIEAEVAELLGEVPPPVERDHTRLFQEPAAGEEQQPPTE